jgi:hypothetical protein
MSRGPAGSGTGVMRASGALVREQGRGRKGGWPVGHPVGWGPAGGGEGGYDRWAWAGEMEKKKRKWKLNQI